MLGHRCSAPRHPRRRAPRNLWRVCRSHPSDRTFVLCSPALRRASDDTARADLAARFGGGVLAGSRTGPARILSCDPPVAAAAAHDLEIFEGVRPPRLLASIATKSRPGRLRPRIGGRSNERLQLPPNGIFESLNCVSNFAGTGAGYGGYDASLRTILHARCWPAPSQRSSLSAAQADVTIEERMSINGAGLMKMANMSGTTTTIISGQRARTESNLQFESGLDANLRARSWPIDRDRAAGSGQDVSR